MEDGSEEKGALSEKVGLFHAIWIVICMLVSVFIIFYLFVTLKYFTWYLSVGGSAEYYIHLREMRQVEIATRNEQLNSDLIAKNSEVLRKNEALLRRNQSEIEKEDLLVRKARYILNNYKFCPAFEALDL